MPTPVDVIVAVPARDEEDRIDACLRGVLAAARHAQQRGVVRSVHLHVGVHRSTDTTAARSRARLANHEDVVGAVHVDDVSTTVGAVRRGLVAAAVSTHGWEPPSTWVFSTDADSRVPVDWLTSTIRQAEAACADAVAGLVELGEWRGSARGRASYDRIVAAGMVGEDGHEHVYGANLAVRLDAYLAVGGFEPVAHGEDRALVLRVRGSGRSVLASVAPVVTTSARMPGRAPQGLGALLHTLSLNP